MKSSSQNKIKPIQNPKSIFTASLAPTEARRLASDINDYICGESLHRNDLEDYNVDRIKTNRSDYNGNQFTTSL